MTWSLPLPLPLPISILPSSPSPSSSSSPPHPLLSSSYYPHHHHQQQQLQQHTTSSSSPIDEVIRLLVSLFISLFVVSVISGGLSHEFGSVPLLKYYRRVYRESVSVLTGFDFSFSSDGNTDKKEGKEEVVIVGEKKEEKKEEEVTVTVTSIPTDNDTVAMSRVSRQPLGDVTVSRKNANAPTPSLPLRSAECAPLTPTPTTTTTTAESEPRSPLTKIRIPATAIPVTPIASDENGNAFVIHSEPEPESDESDGLPSPDEEDFPRTPDSQENFFDDEVDNYDDGYDDMDYLLDEMDDGDEAAQDMQLYSNLPLKSVPQPPTPPQKTVAPISLENLPLPVSSVATGGQACNPEALRILNDGIATMEAEVLHKTLGEDPENMLADRKGGTSATRVLHLITFARRRVSNEVWLGMLQGGDVSLQGKFNVLKGMVGQQ